MNIYIKLNMFIKRRREFRLLSPGRNIFFCQQQSLNCFYTLMKNGCLRLPPLPFPPSLLLNIIFFFRIADATPPHSRKYIRYTQSNKNGGNTNRKNCLWVSDLVRQVWANFFYNFVTQ